MKDQPSGTSPAPPTQPDPDSGTNSKTNQNLVVGLVLGVVVIVLSLLALQITNPDFSGGGSELEKLREQLNAKRQSMGFVDGTTAPIQESPAQMATRLSTESSQLATIVSQLQASVETLRRELQMSQTTVRSLSSQLASATNATIDNDDLHRKLEEALSRANAAESRLGALQQQSTGAPTQGQMEKLLAERDQLRAMITQLQSEEPSPKITE